MSLHGDMQGGLYVDRDNAPGLVLSEGERDGTEALPRADSERPH